MSAILLRQERFGGIAALAGGDTVRVLDQIGFSIFRGVALGLSDDDLIDSVSKQFPQVDILTLKRTLDQSRFLVEHPDEWELIQDGATDDTGLSFPVLSYPLDLSWEITRRCNQHCLHCYNNSSSEGVHPTWDQLDKVLTELDHVQLRSLTITGGEPLMRRDFQMFSERIADIAYNRILSSNATLITKANIGWLSGIYNQASISIDVADKAAYEEFRGRKGSFERCVRGLTLLLKHDVDVVAQTTLSVYNVDAIEELAELLISLGVRSWSVRLPFGSGRAVPNHHAFLERATVMEQAERLTELRERYLMHFDDLKMGVNYLSSYQEPYRPTQNPNKLMTCAAATILATLSADGRLSPCSLFSETDFKSESVWSTSLQKQWQNANCFNEMRNVHLKDIGGCGTCGNSTGRCGGGCRAKSYLAYGTIYRPDNDCNYSAASIDPSGHSRRVVRIHSGE